MTDFSEAKPYENLMPNVVLDSVEAVGFRCTGAQMALNSYENRVYDVEIEGGENVIAKFYRPHRWSREQIQEEHDFTLELANVEIDVVPPKVIKGQTLFESEQGYLFSLSPKRGGQAVELKSEEDFRQVGRLVGRVHSMGEVEPFRHRPALNVKTYGWDNLVFLRQSGHVPADLVAAYDATTTQLLTKLDEVWDGKNYTLRTHGDCHLGNILNDGSYFLVDLDDCVSAPSVQDLWLFVSGDRAEMARQFGLLIEGYEQVRQFNYQELRLVETLRSLRMIHYTAWLARRWDDPTFPKNFPFFDTANYWQKHLQALKEQMAVIDEPLLVSI